MGKRNRLGRCALVVLGTLVLAASTKLFLLPANLMGTGVTGIALIIEHYTGIPMTAASLMLNIATLILAWVVLGRNFALTTIFSSIFYPVSLEIMNQLMGDVQVTANPLLNTLFAGMGVGLAVGLVIRGGGCTGGMDPVLLVLEKYFRLPVSTTMWVIDVCVILGQALYHPVEDVLFGVILVIAMTVTLDKTLLMGKSKTEVKIISDHPCEIRDAIMTGVDRGVTMLHAESGFLHHETNVVLTVISTKELVKIERVAREVDPNCFVIVNRVSEVWGSGFTTEKKRLER